MLFVFLCVIFLLWRLSFSFLMPFDYNYLNHVVVVVVGNLKFCFWFSESRQTCQDCLSWPDMLFKPLNIQMMAVRVYFMIISKRLITTIKVKVACKIIIDLKTVIANTHTRSYCSKWVHIELPGCSRQLCK